MRFGEPNFGGMVLVALMAVACGFLGILVPGRRALAGEVAMAGFAAFVGLFLSWLVNVGPSVGGLNLIPAAIGVIGTFFALRIFEYLIFEEEIDPPLRSRYYARRGFHPFARERRV